MWHSVAIVIIYFISKCINNILVFGLKLTFFPHFFRSQRKPTKNHYFMGVRQPIFIPENVIIVTETNKNNTEISCSREDSVIDSSTCKSKFISGTTIVSLTLITVVGVTVVQCGLGFHSNTNRGCTVNCHCCALCNRKVQID